MKSTDLKSLWQAEGHGAAPPGLEVVQDRAKAFFRQIKRRNWIEYAATAFVVFGFSSWALFEGHPLIRVGLLLVVAASLYISWQLHRRASLEEAPVAPTLVEAIAHLQAQMARQRDALRSVWSWYLLPLVPGMLLVLGGRAILPDDDPTRGPPLGLGLSLFIVLLTFGMIWWGNRIAADKLQEQIDELDWMREELE